MAANGTGAAARAQVHAGCAPTAEHFEGVSRVTAADSRSTGVCIPLGLRNTMPHTTKHILSCGLLSVAVFIAAGCAPKRAPPMTVADLMEDRVTLDGVLLKCNENPAKLRNTSDCLNARVAIERLARDVDPADEAKRNEEFERRREKLRLSQEKLRQEQEAKTKVDPYNMPLVPVDAAAPSGSVSGAGSGPGLAQTQP
jgi:hypothetical protein